MPRKLYLHIGTGKAGSTTIQRYFGTDKTLPFGYDQIEAFGLSNASKIAMAVGTDIARRFWIEETGQLTPAEMDRIAAELWPAAEAELARSDSTHFVASSEYIISHYGFDRSAIEALKQALDRLFDEVVLVLYLRNQLDFLKSFYAQSVKSLMRSTKSYREFVASVDDIRFLWDYAALLDLWADVFGADKLRIAVFDRRNFRDGDLIRDFLTRIDVSEDFLDAHTISAEAKVLNVSPSYTQIRLVRLLNMVEPYVPYDIIRGKLVMQPALEFKGIGFPERYDRMLLDRVAAGNARINATYLADQTVQLPC